MTAITNKQMTLQNATQIERRTDPMSMIELAVQTGANPDHLSKLMDLQERWEKARAAEAYGAAMARFQSLCPIIVKTRKADRFNFAGYDDIDRQIRGILADCGLSVSFDTQHNPDSKTLTATCIIRCGSHAERFPFTCPVPVSLKVSEPQQYGAALSYVKRYALCAALNIVVSNEDTDCNGVLDTINEKQVIQINDMLSVLPDPAKGLDGLLKWVGVKSLEDIPATKFGAVVEALKRKAGGK